MKRAAALPIVVLIAGILAAPTDAAAKRRKKKPAVKTRTVPASFDTRLPVIGTKLVEFPPGPAKPLADQGCLACHSADITAQQRLTEKQWTAEVTKMANWGADIPQDKREELVAYLVKNFGPDAPRYDPVVTRPVGR